MPLYEYECETCGVRFEVIQKFSDAPVETCTSCGGKVRRLLSAPAIQFKGTGWYITDYAKKGNGAEKPPTAPAGNATPSAPGASGAAKPSTSDSSASSSSSPTSAGSTTGSDKK